LSIGGLLLLPEDVQIVPVPELAPEVRARLHASDEDYAITRPRSRSTSSILNAESVELLTSFRTPARIVDAVLAFAGKRERDPQATLEEAYPVLSRLYRMQLLVPADSDRARRIEGELRAGDPVGSFRLVRRIQILDDNEVFLARDDTGRYAAVKYCRGADARSARRLEHEAALLGRLRTMRVPAVLGLFPVSAGLALATEWICGIEALAAAGAFRGPDPARSEHALLKLCIEIVSAFADLHEAGVLHGDVHPRNILIEHTGSVRLIDFGLARDALLVRAGDERGGVAFYCDPQQAQAQRLHQSVAISRAGEQYSIAVLLYHLWTGVHYLDWSLEREEMLRQIVEDDALPFEARRVPPWPALEQILRRALDKSAPRRFLDLRSLENALRGLLAEALQRDRQVRPRRSTPAPERRLLDQVLLRHGLGGHGLRDGLKTAPSASINYGAAGIAYALLRIAQRRGDARLLAAADLWSQKSYGLAVTDGGFYNPELQIERRTTGEASLFHSAAGLHFVRALVSASQCDAASAAASLRAFVEHSNRPCGDGDSGGEIDLTLGKAGLLLGCTELIESVPDRAPLSLAGVRARGAQIAADVMAALQAEPIEVSNLRYLGIAHGWGGLLFALLRWTRAVGGDPHPMIKLRLQELAMLAEPHGIGLRWPIRHGEASFTDGWCNGGAGYAMLFALAQEAFAQAGFGEMAERAALAAASSALSLGSLCCGHGGIGYAALSLHRLTGSRIWLQRARWAVRRAASDRSHRFLRDALYAGAVGVAVLVEDLEEPAISAMPLFEPRR
jgi:serine/threonine-protein kinase